MSTANNYHGYCCKCGNEVQAGAGRVRRYSGANKRSAPAGAKTSPRQGHGYSVVGPAPSGKYAVFCVACDDADQAAKKAAAKAERDFTKRYKAYNTALWALHAEYDAARQATCAARDSGDHELWGLTARLQDEARVRWQAYRVNEPKRV